MHVSPMTVLAPSNACPSALPCMGVGSYPDVILAHGAYLSADFETLKHVCIRVDCTMHALVSIRRGNAECKGEFGALPGQKSFC